VIAAVVLSLPAAASADLTVDTTDDHAPDNNCASPSDCTLRDAIGLANMSPASHATIDFAAGVTGTITLTQGQLAITDPALVIDGPGADVLTVSGNSASRIFLNQTLNAQLTITDLTLADGNVATDGGAIQSSQADLTIERSMLTGNDVTGGAIGGAVSVFDGDLAVEDSTFTGNTSTSQGGAINVTQGDLTMENSTVSGNQAVNGNTGAGGGIAWGSTFAADLMQIRNSTVSNNTAGANGGGIGSFPNVVAPNPILTNSIVANNAAPFPGTDVFGPVDVAFSLVEIDPGTLTTTVPGSNIIGQDPQLGALLDNGGPTVTRRPAAASPVVDRGSTDASTDQRGSARPFNAAHRPDSGASGADGADMGAVELTFAETGSKRCGGKVATIIATKRNVKGTNKADVIVGTKARNVIRGRGGKDVICGLGGPDTLIGGGGPDTLIGGGGADTLRGGGGRDVLRGGPGRDTQVQ
jgi:CSLREA domain-containing protein